MNRPFYVYTPRNILGEDLVHPANEVKYEVRAVHTGTKSYHEAKSRDEASMAAGYLNREHEIELSFMSGI